MSAHHSLVYAGKFVVVSCFSLSVIFGGSSSAKFSESPPAEDILCSSKTDSLNELSQELKSVIQSENWKLVECGIEQLAKAEIKPVIPEVKKELSKSIPISLIELPENAIRVSASAYKMGHTTASGTSVRLGVMAASHDLIKMWGYGCVVEVYGKKKDGTFYKYGEYKLEDKMNQRFSKSCDIYMKSVYAAKQFGRRTMWIVKK